MAGEPKPLYLHHFSSFLPFSSDKTGEENQKKIHLEMALVLLRGMTAKVQIYIYILFLRRFLGTFPET